MELTGMQLTSGFTFTPPPPPEINTYSTEVGETAFNFDEATIPRIGLTKCRLLLAKSSRLI